MGPIIAIFAKFFTTDAILSRLLRGLIAAVLGAAVTPGSGADIYGIHIPPFVVSILGLIAGMIPAGQNNSAVKAVSPKV